LDVWRQLINLELIERESDLTMEKKNGSILIAAFDLWEDEEPTYVKYLMRLPKSLRIF
jgi:hypothetical protein